MVWSIAIPNIESIPKYAVSSESFEHSSRTSTTPQTEDHPATRHLQEHTKPLSEKEILEFLLNGEDGNRNLVALCEAGFVAACQAATTGNQI